VLLESEVLQTMKATIHRFSTRKMKSLEVVNRVDTIRGPLDAILFKRTGQGKKEKEELKVSLWRSAQEKRSKCALALKSTR